jgi:hypothetical protein
MVDETSEQKRLKDRVVLPLLIKHAAPFIDRVLALPMRNIRAAGAAMTAVTTRPREEGGFAVASFRCAVANGVMLRSSATLNKWHRSDIELFQSGTISALMCWIRDVSCGLLRSLASKVLLRRQPQILRYAPHDTTNNLNGVNTAETCHSLTR